MEFENHVIEKLLDQNVVRPSTVVPIVLNKIRTEKWYQQAKGQAQTTKFLRSILAAVSESRILSKLMRTTIIPSMEFEKVFGNIRNAVLTASDSVVLANASAIELLASYSTNDFVATPSEREAAYLKRLLEKLSQNKIRPDVNPDVLRACLYVNILDFITYDAVLPSISNKLANSLRESRTTNWIPSSISSHKKRTETSENVKAQYEESPYPKWSSPALALEKKNLVNLFDGRSINRKAFSINDPNSQKCRVLVAGCGTGQQPIELASQLKDGSVLAIDICNASIEYARRKASEFGVNNLSFQECDILNVEKLPGEFDYIECVGVLHHMDDPPQGLKLLVNKLRSGGIIRLGLYSQIARAPIYEFRKNKQVIGASLKVVKEERNKILNKVYGEDFFAYITSFRDFYNLSEFRDLLFHVQDKAYSIPALSKMISSVNLEFCSFNLPKHVRSRMPISEPRPKNSNLFD